MVSVGKHTIHELLNFNERNGVSLIDEDNRYQLTVVNSTVEAMQKLQPLEFVKKPSKSNCNNDTFQDKDELIDHTIKTSSSGLSHLSHTSDGTSQAYLNLSMMHKTLEHLDFLHHYTSIQVLDISHNYLKDLNGLSELRHLISLNASHNQLTTINITNVPPGIREMNFSNNLIAEIPDLSSLHLLTTFILDFNKIEKICGIQNCHHLRSLSLSHNKISKISGLDHLPIRQIDLSHNSIKRIENLETNQSLMYINMSHNSIRLLRGFNDHPILEEINLEHNEIQDLSEVRYLRDLKMLRILNFEKNPIQKTRDYRLAIIVRILTLVELDCSAVFPEEKVASINVFLPPNHLLISKDHIYNLMGFYQQPVKLLESTLSNNEPYPMLIITGPIGMGKKYLAQRLCQDFPNYFKNGVSHTTCEPLIDCSRKHKWHENEVEGVHYHFVNKERFERLREEGYFLQTCVLYNNFYGVSRKTVEDSAGQQLACVLTMELESVMSFKKTHFEPRYVLLLPRSKQSYENLLSECQCYPKYQIISDVYKIESYTDFNQDHPGYFDSTIVTDSIEERYIQLRKVVLNYLDIKTPPNSTEIDERCNDSLNDDTMSSREKNSSSFIFHSTSSSMLKVKNLIGSHRKMSPAVRNVNAVASHERRYENTKAAVASGTSYFEQKFQKPAINYLAIEVQRSTTKR